MGKKDKGLQGRPEGVSGTLPAVDIATPPVLPVTSAVPPLSPQTSGSNPDIFCPEDSKKWKDKFYGAQGALKQVQASSAGKVGGLGQQVTELTQTVAEKDATIAATQLQLVTLQEQIKQIPDLRGQVGTLTQQAARADRYQLLMEFPHLLGLRVEQMIAGEEGEEPETTTVNPVLQLVEASTLSLEQLRVTLQQFSATLPTATPDATPVSRVLAPAMPPSPAPAGAGGDALWARVQGAQMKLNSGDYSQEAQREHQEAWAAYNKAQIPE